MTTILNGLLGGAVVGVVAAVATHLTDTHARETAIESAAESASTAGRLRALGSSVAYGSGAGGALVALELYVLGVLGVPPSVTEAFAVALGWSVVLLGVALTVRRVLGDVGWMGSRRRRAVVFHLVYGVGLGAWIRLTWIT